MLFSGIRLTEHSLLSPWKPFIKALIQRKPNSELGIYLNVMSKRPRKIADNHCHLSQKFCQSDQAVTWFVLLRNAVLCIIFNFQRFLYAKEPPKCQHCWDRGLLTLLSNVYHSCSQIVEMFQTAWEEDEVKLLQIWGRKRETMTTCGCYKTKIIDFKIPLRS